MHPKITWGKCQSKYAKVRKSLIQGYSGHFNLSLSYAWIESQSPTAWFQLLPPKSTNFKKTTPLCTAHWGKECGWLWNPCEHTCNSDNFWVSKLLSAFLTILSFLPSENPLLFQLYSPTSASLIQIPAFASLLPRLACLCSRVVFPWPVLGDVVRKSWEPGQLCSSAKAEGCSPLACSDGIMVAWLMGAVRSSVLCAEFSEDVVDKL